MTQHFSKLSDEFIFGKHKGHTIEYVIKTDYDYYQWAVGKNVITVGRLILKSDALDEAEFAESEQAECMYEGIECGINGH